MAYTPVPTVTTGDLFTAANYNAYVSANFAAGVPDIFTTAGDMAYGTAADVATRLGIGTALQLLRTNAGATAPEWTTIGVPKMGRVVTDQIVDSGSTGTTLVNGTNMTQAVAASESWLAIWFFQVTFAIGTGGIKLSVGTPTTPTLFFADGHLINSNALSTVTAITTGGTSMYANTSPGTAFSTGIFWASLTNAGNAGNLALQFAQNAAHADDTTLKAGSIMIAIRTA